MQPCPSVPSAPSPLLAPDVRLVLAAAARAGLRPGDPTREPLEVARTHSEAFHAWCNARMGLSLPHRILRPDHDGVPVPLTLHGTGSGVPVLYFHGGGYALNSIRTHAGVMQALSLSVGRPVIGVAYTRAPEARYPQQAEEGMAVLDWLARHGADHGLSAGRPVLAGDSAGAHLALTMAHREPDRLDALLLFYPMVFADFDTASHRLFGGGNHGLSSARMRWFWDHFLPPDGALADQGDFARLPRTLPRTLIVGAGVDCLRDDATRLAERLCRQSVLCHLEVIEGAPHGFLPLGPQTACVAQALQLARSFLL